MEMAVADVAATATRERVEYLEALMSDPDSHPTQAEAVEWFAAVDASKPTTYGQELILEEDDPDIEEKLAAPDEWDAWYQRPIADSLFPRVLSSTKSAPLLQQAVTPSRGASRERRSRSAGSKSSARGEPDRPPLTRLQRARRAISDATRARLSPEWRLCPSCLREQEPEEFRAGRRKCRSCESKARVVRLEAAA